jgi:hypothetical protein
VEETAAALVALLGEERAAELDRQGRKYTTTSFEISTFQCSARVCTTRSAIIPIASSRGSSSHRGPYRSG